MKKRFLKQDIKKWTEIVDLYNDWELLYKIGKFYIPIDFNNWNHSEYVDVFSKTN